ncbi:MAG: UbiE/COQ5 methyltransferase [Parcubacteria group bacterium Licking1014_17]|nr:MAG: UbiE/COQ5 methyltransferase [Parcubacteria group bacterium Licking1014_17]
MSALNPSGFVSPENIVSQVSVAEGMKIADFGSGTGHLVVFLAKAVGESGTVTAIDVLDAALESVASRAKAEGLKNVKTHRGNLEVKGGSGATDNSQDMVTIVNTLFMTPNKEDMLKEAYRILKPGGSLVIVDWRKGTAGPGSSSELYAEDEETIKNIAEGISFMFDRAFDTGSHHFGLIFKKP